MSTILDNKLSNIVSNSYGNVGEAVPTNTLQGQNNLYVQAAGEGIGLYFSSGDNGDEVANLGYASPDFAASSPWVTAVGGTSIGIDKNGKIAYETGWGDTRDEITVNSAGIPVYANAASGQRTFGRLPVRCRRWNQRGLRRARLPARHRSDVALAGFPGFAGRLGDRRSVHRVPDRLQPDRRRHDARDGRLRERDLRRHVARDAGRRGADRDRAAGHAHGDRVREPDAVRPGPHPAERLPRRRPADAAACAGVHEPGDGLSFLITLDTDTSLKTAKGYDDVTGMGGVTFNLLTLLASGRH